MMKLIDIVKANVKIVENSKVTVTVNVCFGTVLIEDENGGEVFLQGDDADRFIDDSNDLYEKVKVISMDEAFKYFAYEYLDVL